MTTTRGVMIGLLSGGVMATSLAVAVPAEAQEQFIPILSYRTGPYAPNGIPLANGQVDYFTMINERDGGINGVKIAFEECDTAYNNDRGVECYERLKDRPGGPRWSHPSRPASPTR